MERFKTFTVLIAKINRNIRRIKTEEMAEYDLKSPHVSCLYYLFKEDGLTAKELSDICDEDKAAISRSIEQLEAVGYLRCNSPSGKRYKAKLELTDTGRDVANGIAEKIDGILDFVSTTMSEDERSSFYEKLVAISDTLEDFCKKYN